VIIEGITPDPVEINKDGSDPLAGKEKSLIECIEKYLKKKEKEQDKVGKQIFEFVEDECEEEYD
jgi:hypothetical protein